MTRNPVRHVAPIAAAVGLQPAGCSADTPSIVGESRASPTSGAPTTPAGPTYDIKADKADPGYPKKIAGNWPA